MGSLRRLLTAESLAGMALFAAAVLGMVCANSSLAGTYEQLLDTRVEVRVGDASLAKPLLLWINDGLMALFFLLIALELKREVLQGELSSPAKVALPLVAAVGGMIVPAAFYAACNAHDAEALRGWAIPAATDIAFALGVLALLGERVPRGVRMFLLSLAVFDDLGAIVIIAAFYTAELSQLALVLAAVATVVLVCLNRLGVTRLGPYFVVGAILWLCVLKSGAHATLAGVVLGLTIPLRKHDRSGHPPLVVLEHALHPWVAFLIVPLFAFANAGVDFSAAGAAALGDTVTLGIAGGLVVGKTLGVFGTSALLVRSGQASLPDGAGWGTLLGVSVLAGIGFTMSLFIATLAFEGTTRSFDAEVRIGVLGGSVLSAVIAFAILHRTLPRR